MKLGRLQNLWMVNNQLSSLPHDLKQLRSLKELDVRMNTPLQSGAKFYKGKELQDLSAFLAEFESGSAIQDMVRVVLVGEGTLACCSSFCDMTNLIP